MKAQLKGAVGDIEAVAQQQAEAARVVERALAAAPNGNKITRLVYIDAYGNDPLLELRKMLEEVPGVKLPARKIVEGEGTTAAGMGWDDWPVLRP